MFTILIVDDSPTIRKMVKASLAAVPGAMFTEAGSGLQAIEAFAVSPVRIVVLDLNMPDMHGLDVLRFVRSHDQYKDVPVIVLTTRGDATSRDAALQAGASAYMTKPFTPSVLASRVNELLALTRVPGVPVPANGM
jgi:two-component system, chemotaxis family, chemotaxis protein CheY